MKYFEVKIKIALISERKSGLYLLKEYSILPNIDADLNKISGKNPEN